MERIKDSAMRILQINTADHGGGAAQVAMDLHTYFLEEGMDAKLGVRFRRKEADTVFEIDVFDGLGAWGKQCARVDRKIAERHAFRGKDRLRNTLSQLAFPARFMHRMRGLEDFNYPMLNDVPNNPGWKPDVLHCHNLHGNYFDLMALRTLSSRVPVIMTLHDTWSFTGHCAHFIDCEKWKFGCEDCPDLRRYVPIRKDKASLNWQYKKSIYEASKLCVVVPSKWLLSALSQSILGSAESRLIPNGVDLRIFNDVDKGRARKELGLSATAFIVLHVAAGSSIFKDYATIQKAVRLVSELTRIQELIFMDIGGASGLKGKPANERHIAYISDRHQMASYFRAADVFVHAANAEVFGLTVAEAQACGVPVVATSIGGISEIVENEVTGFLVPPKDPEAMAMRIVELARDRHKKVQMGCNAAKRVRKHFSLERQADAYHGLYQELAAGYSEQ